MTPHTDRLLSRGSKTSRALLFLPMAVLLLFMLLPERAYSTGVWVDAGHGGSDPGAVVGSGSTRVEEKRINLAVSLMLREELRNRGLRVGMTRTTDVYVGLQDRVTMANAWGANLFVSIHHNAASSSTARGAETLYSNHDPVNQILSARLARVVQQSVVSETGMPDRGVKVRNDLYVLKNTKMPSIIIEGGFLTNSTDLALIASPTFQRKLARAVASGISTFIAEGHLGGLSVPGYYTSARFEQNDGRIAYSGRWVSGSGSAHSGGSYIYSNTTRSTIRLRFRGTSIAWIGPQAPSYGRAEVFVNGKTRGIVSQYAPSVSYQQTIWSISGLPEGEHTLLIRVLGTKEAASSGTVIVADAFDVGTAMRPLILPELERSARFEQNDPRLGYSGRWITGSGAMHSGGSYVYSSTMGATVKATFRGTSIAWVGPKAPSYGQAEIWLNGTRQGTVSQYAPSTSLQQVIWSASGLPDGEHTVVIRVTGTRESASSGNVVVIDAFDVADENRPDLSGSGTPFTGWAEESDPAVRYVGSWHSGTGSVHSGGGYRYARDSDSYAIIEFTGTSIYWIGPRSSSYGQAEIFLDGVRQGVVSQYADATSFQQVIWQATGLSSGTHTLVIRATGSKEAASSGNTIVLDAFSTERPPRQMAPATFEETAPEVREAGRWVRGSSAAFSGGGYTYSHTAGSTLRMSFTGTSVAWIGPRAPSYGQAEIFLDGASQGTVSQYSPSVSLGETIWGMSDLEDGFHTLTIRVLGTAEPASSGRIIVVDALQALVPVPPDAITVLEENSSGVTRSGTWILSTNSMFSGRGYAYSRAAGSRMIARFTGEAVTVIGPKGPAYGRFDVYVDGVKRGTASQYAPTVLYQQPIFTVTGLSSGRHTIEVRVTNTKEAASSGTTVVIDGFDAARER